MTADGPTLERVRERAGEGAGAPPRRRVFTPRAAIMSTLAVGLVVGAQVSHAVALHDVAALAGSITSPVANQPDHSAAGIVYCGPGSGSGGTGWAPTFRWHYGYPTTNV